ncbi:MAG: 2-amino-4-hydroxy-6-hydroxymethyldihydropteridine diphosphokinase [Deltaproteobacteria bacterium]|jgi:2-amino-4-hydroxy-6-hydroxymethyldihydropteridine diphosphokinase|nr:2-amino-4-hydroxy-6-hydroxymethyldihydropteridine diphosphokinase [Deltaproteobacteria bacterium]
MIHTAYIGAGSNIGNKLLNCKNGISALSRSQHAQIKEWSQFYKTEPVDYEDQDWFINIVVKIETSLDPFQLLKKIKSIEHDAGRSANPVRFGPRVLDLDILLFDDVVTNSSGLIIPHPRMHKRRFVLQPICDIDPKIVHPVLKKEMKDLLALLDDNEQRIIEYQ